MASRSHRTQARTRHRSVDEAQGGEIANRLNWLRAGVMGANDGIVSTSGMVVGVAGAALSNEALMAAGISAAIAGALSMAVGEYVSVSSQRDSQRAELEIEKAQLANDPRHGLDQLTELVEATGVDRHLAHQVAVQLTKKDALAAHARFELHIDPDELANPWQAGLASMLAFTAGALIPLLAMLLSPRPIAVPVTATAVVMALALTGVVSAHLGRASKLKAGLRTVGGGLLTMTVTFAIGSLIGIQM
jgi:vacuolar iron transporter family protein